MRRKILGVLAGLVLAAAWIAPADPAAAAYVQPGQIVNRSWNGCNAQVVYGTFGNAFGEVTPLGNGCAGDSSVRIFAAYQGTVTAHTCVYANAVFHPGDDPNCRFLLNTGGWRSTVVSDTGGAFRVDTKLCGVSSCHTFSDGLFG
jgi:hypothetical protein